MGRVGRIGIKVVTSALVVLVFSLLSLVPALPAGAAAAERHSAADPAPADTAAAVIGKIAFASDRDGNFEIYVMDANGGGQVRLTQDPGEDFSPAWSPDGSKLAFVSTRDGNSEIYVMNSDGTGQTRLTQNTDADLAPAWSPDGVHIAFVSSRDGNDEIYVMDANGGNQTNLTMNQADDSSFAYSPDGKMIVFSSKREDEQFNIYRMGADGSGVTRLTTTAGDDIDPSWSAGQIAFQSNRDENDEIYTMAFNGQNQRRLTMNTDFDENPAQSTDGSRIVFASSRDGNLELYAANPDGSALTRLTTNNASDLQPAVQQSAVIPQPPAAGAAIVQFSSTDFSASEGAGVATITVVRTGSTTGIASVDFATIDGTAINKTDYSPAFGTLNFAAGETSKNFSVLLTDDVFIEGDESLTITLSNASGAALGSLNTATLKIVDNDTAQPSVNPIDNTRFFVTQHYSDFLSRVPDQGGLDYWISQINQCGNNLPCLISRRNDVSGFFFTFPEFQDTGFYVIRLYKGSLGVPPTYQQFIMDRSRVIGGATLADEKVALANDFVTRDAFTNRYPASLSPEEFVNRLFDTAGLVPFTAERQQLAVDIRNGKTRAQAVMQVIEIQQFRSREFNPAFVLMQYFGYLRRDIDPDGFAFWLDVLNRDPSNISGMVCSFITSTEYQSRFSSVITANNSQCSIH